jgi:hypothetical protein
VGLVEAEHFEAEGMAGVEHREGALVGHSKIAVVNLRDEKGELEDKWSGPLSVLRRLSPVGRTF